MIRESCIKIHNDSLRKSFALICGLCILKVYLPEKEYDLLKEEIKGMNWWNVYGDMIECRKNINVDKELIYGGEYQSFKVYCDKSTKKIYANY